MAISMWQLSAITLGMTTLSWFLSPLIAFFLPKFLSRPPFDAPRKLRELEFVIIPKIKVDLAKVDELRVLRGAKKGDRDILKSLHKQAGRLRHALYEAEDILDLVDYYQIERKVVPDGESRNSSWLQQRWWVQPFDAAMGQHDGDSLHMSGAQLPLSHAPLASWVCRTYRWFRSLEFKNMSFGEMSFRSCLSSLVKIAAKIFEFSNYYRDWFDELTGITNYQDIGVPLDSGSRLKKRIEKLENILSEVEKSHALSLPSNGAQTAKKTRSSTKGSTAPTERKIFGRDIARDDIINRLIEGLDGDVPNSSSSKSYSVVGICGIAGSGKTTLARHVHDRIKQDGRFDSTMFIHVSETFTVEDIFRDMLKGILKLDNIGDCEEVQMKLEKELRGKRFFLVLDDLWLQGDNSEKLKELLSPLDAGLKGSRMLVTSRSIDVARSLCADEPILIPDLQEADYLAMFMHHALDGSGVDDRLFRPVGRKIAAKLLGSPIAAVTVAGQLRQRPNIRFWEETATLDVLNETRGALWWSYQQLDVGIRRCFEYCTIFPRRFVLHREDLVSLWLAQGFVKCCDATEDMEDIADGYVEDLVSCSFLQRASAYVDIVDIFTIHDLLHDLADRVTGSDCFRIEKNGPRLSGDIPQDVCHLFIENYDASLITEKILELEHLRSLIICSVGRRVTVEENVIENIFKKLLKLRVLAIPFALEKDVRIEEPAPFSIPESITQLKHLSYLAFMGNTFRRVILPSALNKLYHLQLLKFGSTEKLEFSYADLINLRQVICKKSVEFSNIGRLISLQTLELFRVQNKQGCEVKQLRNLNKLRGGLYISGLENVKSKEEALEANLVAKERLRGLGLSWDDGGEMCFDPVVAEDVIEGLCPPMDLQRLSIFNYKGSRYPIWMVDRQSNGPKNLNHLLLSGWSQLGPAPELDAFIHLCELLLESCSWNGLASNMVNLTLLKKLTICKCMNIQSLPTLPLSLEYIELNNCNAEFLMSCETFGHQNYHKIMHVPYKQICTRRCSRLIIDACAIARRNENRANSSSLGQ